MNQPGYRPGHRPAARSQSGEFGLFTAAAEPPVVSTRFWMQLLRYRPVILLGSLWLGLICVAAVAYSRLMFAGVPITPTGSRSTAVEPAALPSSSADGAGGTARPDPTSDALPSNRADRAEPYRGYDELTPESLDQTLAVPFAEDVAAAAEPASEGVPAWSLAALVGLCAGGCFLMQRRVTAAPQPRKVRSDEAMPPRDLPRGLKSAAPQRGRGRARSQRPALARTGSPKRLQPFSPERDQIVVPNRPPVIAAKLSQAQPDGVASAPLPPQVAVVPPQEAITLDWPEGSLAHSLDMRQRRSLSSFL